MDTIARLFLRAKHWQIFLLLVGVRFIGNLAVVASSMSATAQSPADFGKLGLQFGCVTVLFMFCFLRWFWSMGSFLGSIVRPALRLNTKFFHFALVYPALYIFVFIALLESFTTNPALLAIVFPLHFFAMFCIFYGLYFVSKSLGHFFSSGFSLSEFGLPSQESIDFTKQGGIPNQQPELRRASSPAALLRAPY